MSSQLNDNGTSVLAVIERQLGLKWLPFKRTYVRVGKWRIASRSLRLARLVPRVEMLLPDFFEARRLGATCRLPLSCCALYERERGGASALRSFYPSNRVTIKMVSSERNREQVHKDIQARSLIATSGKLRVPQILASGDEGDSAFLMEELVLGHHPVCDKKSVRALMLQMWGAYHALSFSLTERLPMSFDDVKEELRRIPIPQQMKHERECRDELVRRLQNVSDPKERPLLAAFGHGDLSLGNIIATSAGQWFIIDWEQSGHMAVAWDLRKLMGAVPSLIPEITHLIHMELQCRRWRDAMTAEDQCLVALGGRIAFYSKRKRRKSRREIRTIKLFRPLREWLQAPT